MKIFIESTGKYPQLRKMIEQLGDDIWLRTSIAEEFQNIDQDGNKAGDIAKLMDDDLITMNEFVKSDVIIYNSCIYRFLVD